MAAQSILRFAVVQLCMWATYAVIHYFASLPAVQRHEWGVLALMNLTRATTGLAISTALGWWLRRRANPERAGWWLGAAGLGTAAAAAWLLLDRILLASLAPFAQTPVPWYSVPHGLELEYWFVMLAWTGGLLGVLLLARSRALRDQLLREQIDAQEARLQAFVTQLNPHFLFNALNTIRSLAAEDAPRAREMLTRLAALLRRALNVDATTPVSLRDELDFTLDYVRIQEARFEAALDVVIDVPTNLQETLVPPMILQPLVENAIQHGVPDEQGVRRVRVSGSTTGAHVELRVENRGRLNAVESTGGIGTSLTRRRLKALYGEASDFDLAQVDGYVRATLRMPAARP